MVSMLATLGHITDGSSYVFLPKFNYFVDLIRSGKTKTGLNNMNL